MRKIDKSKGVVLNFGDFTPNNISNLTYYYTFNKNCVKKYTDIICLAIKCINNWIDITNNEMIIDFIKSFRIKKADGDWL
jgi:hypothetical protein